MDILKKYEEELSASEIQRPAENMIDPESAGPLLKFLQKNFGEYINQKQANMALIGTAIFLFIFSFWILSSKKITQPSQKMINDALQRTVDRLQSQFQFQQNINQ